MRCRSCKPVPDEVRRAAGLIERRWAVSILYASSEGAVRFNEFRQAQKNLAANIAAGRGNSFAYFGAGTGTAPLPPRLACSSLR